MCCTIFPSLNNGKVFYDKDHKSAKQQRKEYYPLHIAAANDKTISDTDRSDLEKKYKGALLRKTRQRKLKRHKTLKSCRHMRTFPKLFIVLQKTSAVQRSEYLRR
jgi:hypothetical protein